MAFATFILFSGGLLFCYEPKLDVGRDGRMARRHLVSRGRAYQHMMVTLVNEVCINMNHLNGKGVSLK